MNETPLVSVIIVNWNGESFLNECLASVTKTAYPNIEIIVVDNNSTDNSIQIIKNYKGIKFQINKENLGYTGGNNIGFKLASGKYVVTLNNDMTVNPQWLDKPVQLLEKDLTLGIISCRQMQYFKPELIDGLFNSLKRDLSFVPFAQNKKYHSSSMFCTSGYILFANGGSAVLRKDMLNEIGIFDENFFGYFDETDLCIRGFLHGWKCAYVSDSVVYHKGGVSFKQNPPFRYYLRERNKIWFVYKNFPLSLIITNLPFLLFMEMRVIRIFFLKCKKPSLYFKSRIDAISSLGQYRSIRKKNVGLFKNRKSIFAKLWKNEISPF